LAIGGDKDIWSVKCQENSYTIPRTLRDPSNPALRPVADPIQPTEISLKIRHTLRKKISMDHGVLFAAGHLKHLKNGKDRVRKFTNTWLFPYSYV
jgi:hypothetical protein